MSVSGRYIPIAYCTITNLLLYFLALSRRRKTTGCAIQTQHAQESQTRLMLCNSTLFFIIKYFYLYKHTFADLSLEIQMSENAAAFHTKSGLMQ